MTLNFPLSLTDGTFNECRKRFKLAAQFATDADKALIDAWFASEMDDCAAAYHGSRNPSVKRGAARDFEKLTKRRALWESLRPELDRTANEPAAVETEAAAEPETELAPVLVKILENMTNGTKVEISRIGACSYFVTRYEYVSLVGWRKIGDAERYDKDCLEWEFHLSGNWENTPETEPQPAAAPEAEAAAEPESSHDEPKTEQAARPEGRKIMNANFDFFAGCADEDTARKRYYQLSKVYHPDTGIGDTETMAVITDQYQAFMGRSSVASDIPELPSGVIALPEHRETPAAVDEAAEYVDAIAAILKLNLPGVEAKIVGKWVWVSGLSAEMKDAHAALKAAGYRFSGGKKMWYWVPSSEQGQKKHYRGTASMGYIRAKYGSRKLDLDGLSA